MTRLLPATIFRGRQKKNLRIRQSRKGGRRLAGAFCAQAGDRPAHIRGRCDSVNRAGRSSDFRIVLLAAPSPCIPAGMAFAAFVPDYSGGTAVDLHHLPYFESLTRETRT